jgi:phospholipase C
MQPDRRRFLQLLTAGVSAGALPASIGKALAIPANNTTGTIADVKHVVILMQENRSFDHYLGTLNGVRGFADPRAATLSTGQSVFHQPAGTNGTTLPFHPKKADLGLAFIEDLPHDWDTTHIAWNKGQWDGWIAAKTTSSMAYLTRADIPFHYALADAFTICDAYHAALLGPTSPNRYYMWSGWVGNDGNGGGPVIDNSTNGYSWGTFPERLQAAGVTWKVYQDVGTGLSPAQAYGEASDALIGNYGDNALLYFNQYINAAPGSALYQGACTGTDVAAGGGLFDIFAADVKNNTLPQVSWVVAPEAYTEHPNWPANYGAFYVSQILDALTANPELWSKTALIVTYDENDGFFDHMVPPTVPFDAQHGASTVSTVNEIYPGTDENVAAPYGLGVRVPCFVVSPWSKGGYVNSQLFDHTSLIRFIGAVFDPHGKRGLAEPNITPWRAAVCGDLTTAFNFKTPNAAVVALPSTAAYAPPNGTRKTVGYVPVPPVLQALPKQETGARRTRAMPYKLHAYGVADSQTGTVSITFANPGTQAAVFLVRSANVLDGQRSYTVEPGKTLSGTWSSNGAPYDLSVSGPNGFLRRFAGSTLLGGTGLTVLDTYLDPSLTIILAVTNTNPAAVSALVTDMYTDATTLLDLAPGQTKRLTFARTATYGWYDLLVTIPATPSFGMQLAGHIEHGGDSITDPMIG